MTEIAICTETETRPFQIRQHGPQHEVQALILLPLKSVMKPQLLSNNVGSGPKSPASIKNRQCINSNCSGMVKDEK